MPRKFFTVCLAGALGCCALPAIAADYPTRPIKVIVPFSPGGAVDGPMRVIAQELCKRWGQQVIIENRPGAGATIGTDVVAKAAPDGYTLLLASQTNAISATLYRKLPFDPIEDFATISLIGREPGVLVVNPALPVKTLQEFIAYAKARPGQVDYASSGNGSGQHLFMAMLASMTGMKMTHVPYSGSGQATTDLVGGQVPVSMPGLPAWSAISRPASCVRSRSPARPARRSCPTCRRVAESGVPGYEAYVWMGLLAPKGTPAAGDRQLNRDGRSARTNEVKNYMATRRHRDRRRHAGRIRRVLPRRERDAMGTRHPRNRRQDRVKPVTTRRRMPMSTQQRAVAMQRRPASSTGRAKATCAFSCGRNSSARPKASPPCCSCTARRWHRSRRST